MITGITPGIHINLVASIIVAYSYYILKILDPINIVIIITSMAITHTILDIIPSTLLGIANSENLTMLMPAHKLTIEGKSKLAIQYGFIGSALGILATSLIIPIIIFTIPFIYSNIKNYIPYILIIICMYIILKSKNKLLSIVFFISTGIIGIISFNIKTINQPLLPLLSGIFGLSSLILGIKNNVKIPEQKDVKIEVSNKELVKFSLMTTLSSLLTNFLPGLTSSYTSLISTKLNKIKDQNHHIIISNIAGSSATIISFVAFYSINKARSGAVATIQYLITSINITTLILVISVSLITLSISTFIAIKLTNKIIKKANKINYQKLSILIMILIIILVLIITKLEGLVILITATSIGILADKLNLEKIFLTGCLVLPVILYSLL